MEIKKIGLLVSGLLAIMSFIAMALLSFVPTYALTVTNYNDVTLTNYNVYSTYYALRMDTTNTSSIESANLTTVYIWIPYFDGYLERNGGVDTTIQILKPNGYTYTDYTVSLGKWNRVQLDQTGVIDRVIILLMHNRGNGFTASELNAIDQEILIFSPDDYQEYTATFEGETGFGEYVLDLRVFSFLLELIGSIFMIQIGFFTVGMLAMIPIGFALFKWLLKMLGKG